MWVWRMVKVREVEPKTEAAQWCPFLLQQAGGSTRARRREQQLWTRNKKNRYDAHSVCTGAMPATWLHDTELHISQVCNTAT